ncbi:MAG TPA: hypothetical protein PKC97_04115 [Burkholderiaceae bacterium]|jgi:CubicO group peptidase (beta-lactamase class C family)|nr:hypothetical protein [Burkholderiaceae bacterium]
MDHGPRLPRFAFFSPLLACLTLTACGGGGSDGSVAPPSRQAAAATATAQSNPLCSVAALGSYYWEIGDRNGVLVAGSMGAGGVSANTVMNIASASKWLFAGYVYEKFGGPPSLVPFLNFTSGYSNLNSDLCVATGTVSDCMNGGINASEAATGMFHYQGGHMQQLAVNLGLGAMRNDALATEVRSQLGTDISLQYVEPLAPGGVRTSAANYAVFLRKLLIDSPAPLRLGIALGTHAVCTQPSPTCNASPDTAAALPENFHYSLGHWVEDDPSHTPSSNFAYSSAGKFGFYPWVDFDRKLYGIVARDDPTALATGEGYASLECGRLIRLAWKTGIAQ